MSAPSWLLLLLLGEAMSKGPGTASPAGVRLGNLLVDMFYAAAFVLAVYGVIGTDSAAQTVLYLPRAVQEMVLAVRMVARQAKVVLHILEPIIETVGGRPYNS